ncbi:Predicted acyltransferase [Catalinimonas alkaloidigena]|uniref:Predicted acyltransferase n=1 Tax=Catalinimonas alkaloidigena TaxID=1075417 RepID=A0A1G9IZG1_9BACT|nr:DUF5009 domain-containing protein [Catalinimonas alkaloidigena]SDL30647.1 Predicted acyltransferase [Catalinimonas alkaloidigena]
MSVSTPASTTLASEKPPVYRDKPSTASGRVVSIDFMRGVIMFLLAAESTLLYERLYDVTGETGFWAGLVEQFFHVPWEGLHFWDLVQPSFMLIAGTSLYFSTQKRLARGESFGDLWRHTLVRSLKLLACGVGLHCVYAGELVWELWNVLSQLSVTLIVAFALIRQSVRMQLIVSFVLILLTDVLYRFFPLEGFNQPFVPDHSFGTWMDLVLMGKINDGHWIAINFLPTAAHTIWGVVAGKWLASDRAANEKIKLLLIAAAVGLVLGYALDWTGVSPIIKRICTAGFVLASGGWVFALMAFCYALIDVRKGEGASETNWIRFFIIVGMNPIFIYLLFETLGHQWLNQTVGIFTNGLTGFLGFPEPLQWIVTSLATLMVLWYICYWLYQKRIFIKL